MTTIKTSGRLFLEGLARRIVAGEGVDSSSLSQVQCKNLDAIIDEMGNMTTAETVKSYGITSLKEVSEATKVSPHTLRNWSRDRPELFGLVLQGMAARIDLME